MKKVIILCTICIFIFVSAISGHRDKNADHFQIKDVSLDMKRLNHKLENIDSLLNSIR